MTESTKPKHDTTMRWRIYPSDRYGQQTILNDLIGFLPEIFLASDPRDAQDQANDRYAHGGGWRPQEGWVVDTANGHAYYPGDDMLKPVAFTELSDQVLWIYPYGYVCAVDDDGSYQMCRMD